MRTASGISLTTQDILEALPSLKPVDLEKVARRVRRLRSIPPGEEPSRREAYLLKIVRRRRPAAMYRRYRELARKLEMEALTPEERQELMPLIEESEMFAVKRLEALMELAALRKTDLPQLMEELGIRPERV